MLPNNSLKKCNLKYELLYLNLKLYQTEKER